jgi:hypothetical protein
MPVVVLTCLAAAAMGCPDDTPHWSVVGQDELSGLLSDTNETLIGEFTIEGSGAVLDEELGYGKHVRLRALQDSTLLVIEELPDGSINEHDVEVAADESYSISDCYDELDCDDRTLANPWLEGSGEAQVVITVELYTGEVAVDMSATIQAAGVGETPSGSLEITGEVVS